jgi:outer membrane protein TolC
MRRLIQNTLLGALLFTGTLALGQDSAEDLPVEPTVEEIALRDAIGRALENGIDFELIRFQPWIVREGVRSTRATYDPVIFSMISTSDTTSATSSSLAGASKLKTETVSIVSGMRGALRPGTAWEFSLSADKNETNSSFSTLNPRWDIDASLEVSQPLLKGFGDYGNYSSVLISQSSARASIHQFAHNLSALVLDVEQAYWELLGAEKDLEVADASLRVARKLVEDNEARFAAQAIAEIELIQSRAGEASRRQDQIVARQRYEDARDALLEKLDPDWWQTAGSLQVVLTDDPELDEDVPNEDGAVAAAMAYRKDLQVMSEAIEQQQLALLNAENELQPTLDAFAALGYEGLGRSINQSRDLLDDGDFRNYTFGLSFELPWENALARSNETQARLEMLELVWDMRRLENDIRLEVRTAVRGIRSARERVEAARTAADLAKAEYDAEDTRLKQGLSTTWRVLDAEDGWVEARQALIQAWLDYRVAWASYLHSIGRLLEQYDIVLDEQIRPKTFEDIINE